MTSSPTPSAVGIDIGGSGIRAAVVSSDGQLASDVLTRSHTGQPLLDEIPRIVDPLLEEYDLDAAGIAFAGTLRPGTSIVASSPTAPGLVGVDLRASAPPVATVSLVNDANAALIGEHAAGAARESSSPIGIFIGTGVGGAAIMAGRLVRGSTGSAAEFGHIIVDPQGHPCGCGGVGCLEAQASGRSVLREYFARNPARAPADGAQLASWARSGDAVAKLVFSDQGRHLGIGLATIIHALDPDLVVIGGRGTKAWDLFEDSMRNALRRHTMHDVVRSVDVVRAALPDTAGLIGAALHALGVAGD